MELEETQKLAEQLEGREIYIKVKEKDGKLFGSVNEKTIAKTLKEEGMNIDPENVKLAEPIKEMGEYDAQISLDHGLEANIRLILVSEEEYSHNLHFNNFEIGVNFITLIFLKNNL